MLVLTLISGNACAIHHDDILTLKEDTGTINGNYNRLYTEVSLKSGGGYNVMGSVLNILDKIEKEKEKCKE